MGGGCDWTLSIHILEVCFYESSKRTSVIIRNNLTSQWIWDHLLGIMIRHEDHPKNIILEFCHGKFKYWDQPIILEFLLLSTHWGYHTDQGIKHFQHPRKFSHAPFELILSVPLELPTIFISVTTEQFIFFFDFHVNHTACTLLCLSSLTQDNICEIHPCCFVYQNFTLFLLMCGIPLSDYILIYLSLLSVDGYLGVFFFQFCTIMNKAVMNVVLLFILDV